MKPSRWLTRALLLALCVPLFGCYESPVPLGPPAAAAIDSRLLGTWRCVEEDEDQTKPILFTVLPFDDRQYYVAMASEGEKTVHYRAYSSAVKGTPLLNIRELGPTTGEPVGKWYFVRYSFFREKVLFVQVVTDGPFKGVEPTATAVRQVVENNLDNADLYMDFCACIHVTPKK